MALVARLGCSSREAARPAASMTTDGRASIEELTEKYASLEAHGWLRETLHAYDDGDAIRAWRTPERGPALWILAGIHGEEPAGPNALAESLGGLLALAESGVAIVVAPLCNPRAYRNGWRYPNTPERDWHKGGYSVGDAEYLLEDLGDPARPRAATAPGPETIALTQFVLRTAEAYPPRLVLDLHEDELATEGGYIYSQGIAEADNPVATQIIRLLQNAGMPLRLAGETRFGEPIVRGQISQDKEGRPIRDGSIDELFAAREIFRDGRKVAGPSARTVIVVETPAFAGSQLALRVAAHAAVLREVAALWRINEAVGARRSE
jgi:hypothetical protein